MAYCNAKKSPSSIKGRKEVALFYLCGRTDRRKQTDAHTSVRFMVSFGVRVRLTVIELGP